MYRNECFKKPNCGQKAKTVTEVERAVLVHFKHLLPRGPAALHKRPSDQRCRLIKKSQTKLLQVLNLGLRTLDFIILISAAPTCMSQFSISYCEHSCALSRLQGTWHVVEVVSAEWLSYAKCFKHATDQLIIYYKKKSDLEKSFILRGNEKNWVISTRSDA